MKCWLVRILFLIWLIPAIAQAVDCTPAGVVRCLCAASMDLQCEDGSSGWVLNEEKVSSIRVTVFDPSTGRSSAYQLDNPPKGVRSYSGGADKDSWVLSNLKKQGVTLKSGARVDLTKVSFSAKPKLFKDNDGKTPIDEIPPQASKYEGVQCDYDRDPVMLSGSSCNENLCAGSATCTQDGVPLGSGLALACRALGNGQCPTAMDCVNDENIKVQTVDVASSQSDSSGAQHKNTGGKR